LDSNPIFAQFSSQIISFQCSNSANYYQFFNQTMASLISHCIPHDPNQGNFIFSAMIQLIKSIPNPRALFPFLQPIISLIEQSHQNSSISVYQNDLFDICLVLFEKGKTLLSDLYETFFTLFTIEYRKIGSISSLCVLPLAKLVLVNSTLFENSKQIFAEICLLSLSNFDNFRMVNDTCYALEFASIQSDFTDLIPRFSEALLFIIEQKQNYFKLIQIVLIPLSSFLHMYYDQFEPYIVPLIRLLKFPLKSLNEDKFPNN
jgi:hypothetical protein